MATVKVKRKIGGGTKAAHNQTPRSFPQVPCKVVYMCTLAFFLGLSPFLRLWKESRVQKRLRTTVLS